MKRIGFTTTIPVEFILAGGNIPVDLNNIFVCSPNPNHLIDEAQNDGLPRNCCSWIKGLYSVAVKEKAVDEIISVTNGDCSNTHALTELYSANNILSYEILGKNISPAQIQHERELKDKADWIECDVQIAYANWKFACAEITEEERAEIIGSALITQAEVESRREERIQSAKRKSRFDKH